MLVVPRFQNRTIIHVGDGGSHCMHSMHESSLVEETSSGMPTSTLASDETRPINVCSHYFRLFATLIMKCIFIQTRFFYECMCAIF